MDFLSALLVLVSLGALLALPVIWLVGRTDSRGRATAAHPESSADVALSAATEARSPLGAIGLAFSVVAVPLCLAGLLAVALPFTSWYVSFDTGFYLTVAGAVGLFPAVAGLAYGLVALVRAKKSGVRDVAGRWAVRLSVVGLSLMGIAMAAALVLSRSG
jgi:hypothetical protein